MTSTDHDTTSDLSYRPHLDGLRAVAVVMVFFFHATPTSYGAGFLGVDVFFVLSGYLITRILIEEWSRSGTLDLGRFYSRRVRRLTPALAALLIVMLIRELTAGSILTFGDRMQEVFSTALYYANWNLIAASDDYFGGFAEASPLRHAWSLAIEEQFYFVWPLVVWGLLRLTGRRTVAIGVAAVVSILSVLSMWQTFENDSVSAAYYRTDTRVHGLLVGAILGAAYARRRLALRPSLGWVVGPTLGVLLILSWTWDAASSTYFSGGSLLVATLSALLIAGLEESPDRGFARVLASPPFVALGKISYGFYLWHWPVILWFPASDALGVAIQFALSLAAATISWFVVEQRFSARSLFSRRVPALPTIAVGVLTMVAIAVVSTSVERPSADAAIEGALEDPSSSLCDRNFPPCVKVEAAAGRPTIAILGDSTAQAWLPALTVIAEERAWRIIQVAVGGCPLGTKLMIGADGVPSDRQQQCFDLMPDAVATIAATEDVQLVVATSRSELNDYRDGDTIIEVSTDAHRQSFITDIDATLRPFIADGAQIALLDVVPDGPPIDCVDTDTPCELILDDGIVEDEYNELLEAYADTVDTIHYAAMLDHVCPNRRCALIEDGEVIRYDGVHFTGTTSRNLADELEAELVAAGLDLDAIG